jgi:tripartite ATP-independent transporter DctM subunit
MGGMAMLLFYGAPIPISISAVPLETFRIVADPTLASLPLFTLAGYLLAEGGASKRLVHLFQVAFGWLPGGVAAAAVLVCAFFTTFTGASGVTILALGGLLLPALIEAGYKEKFAVGLLAAAGSIGLLFPPSLPVILYGVASKVPIPDLFLGGAVPGALLVFLLVAMSVGTALRQRGLKEWFASDLPLGERVQTRLKDIAIALWGAKFEVLLPVFVLVGFFGGYVTIFEAAAFTAFYALLIEVVIHRDLHPFNDLPAVLVESAKLMGGVLVILGVALGFTNYLVDAEVPLLVRDWVQANVGNKIMFLLMLNLLLLLVGCLMDIYSAIIVIVPLIIPVSAIFGIHPVHLGILFLANLELGYLTPPVGLNLFLASYRFKIPLTRVYRYAMPFLGVMAIGVLLIAYVPILTTWGLEESTGEPVDFFADELDEPLTPSAPPMGLDPAALQKMLEEEGDAEPSPPVKPPKLDMDAIFEELNADDDPSQDDTDIKNQGSTE